MRLSSTQSSHCIRHINMPGDWLCNCHVTYSNVNSNWCIWHHSQKPGLPELTSPNIQMQASTMISLHSSCLQPTITIIRGMPTRKMAQSSTTHTATIYIHDKTVLQSGMKGRTLLVTARTEPCSDEACGKANCYLCWQSTGGSTILR